MREAGLATKARLTDAEACSRVPVLADTLISAIIRAPHCNAAETQTSVPVLRASAASRP
jgi:hypothetical protein